MSGHYYRSVESVKRKNSTMRSLGVPAKKQRTGQSPEENATAIQIDEEIDRMFARFGEQVRLLRKSRHVTHEQICERTGLTSGAISRIEHGERSLAARSMVKLALGLGMQPSELAVFLDSGPRANATSRLVLDVPVLVGPGTRTETVRNVTRELESVKARPRQVSRKRSGS